MCVWVCVCASVWRGVGVVVAVKRGTIMYFEINVRHIKRRCIVTVLSNCRRLYSGLKVLTLKCVT